MARKYTKATPEELIRKDKAFWCSMAKQIKEIEAEREFEKKLNDKNVLSFLFDGLYEARDHMQKQREELEQTMQSHRETRDESEEIED